MTYYPTATVAGCSVRIHTYLAPWRSDAAVFVEPDGDLPETAPDGHPWRHRRNGTVLVRPTDLDHVVTDSRAPVPDPNGFAPYADLALRRSGPPSILTDPCST
ncbi:hypothetical protein [Curtobacterium luteum]|uniref:hypothetical protein n=1 Tax=Curtobacterium luteum TaxID=33881 RepID=UPI0038248167